MSSRVSESQSNSEFSAPPRDKGNLAIPQPKPQVSKRPKSPNLVESPVERLTLEVAWQMAERFHPALAEARALVEAADGRVKQAGLYPNPEVVTRMESAPFTGNTTGDAEYLGGISQPIPLGGRLSKARRVEKLKKETLVKSLNLKKRVIRSIIHQTFVTAVYYEQVVQVRTEILRNAQKDLETIEARFEAGDATKEEVARTQLEHYRVQKDEQESRASYNRALIDLASAVGEPTLEIRSLRGSLSSVLTVPSVSNISTALNSHPALEMSEANLAAAEAQVDLAKALRVSDINLEVLYRRIEQPDINSFDMGIRIPIPLFNRNQGKLMESGANVEVAVAQVKATHNELIQAAKKLHSQLTTALERAVVLKEQALPEANTMLKSAESRFSLGDASLTEILPIRREWAEVQLNYLEVLKEAALSWAKLIPYLQ